AFATWKISIACANITMVRVPKATLGSWFGPGVSTGQIQFYQSVPNGPTNISVSLSNLNAMAGGYHVHILPIKPNSSEPCSAANIRGHYNPLSVNITLSPPPGNGTLYRDSNLPLTGPHSIVGRSVVIHYSNDDIGEGFGFLCMHLHRKNGVLNILNFTI
uniref:Uncharacterized protein n=1 Tax=Hippocampus comes TaxID=109280 RepID=A0A3Q2YI83_HIPCM